MRIELATEIQGQQVKGIAELKKLADEGNADACNILGTWLLSGLNCSPDAEMAARFFEKAAKKGNTKAMINLALCYAEGRGVNKNFELAELWIRTADECGDVDAQIPARQIYFSTIGDHTPDLAAYADYLVGSMSANDTGSSKKSLMNRYIAHMVLGELEKERNLNPENTKVTDNDIKAFEVLNDIFYGDPIDETPSEVPEYVKKKITGLLLDNIDSLSRNDIAERILILYYLSSSEEQKKSIENMGHECSDKFSCDKPLTWLMKSKYEAADAYLGSFDSDTADSCVAILRSRLNAVENNELSNEMLIIERNLQMLLTFRKRLEQTRQYGAEVSREWHQTATEKIVMLENKELSERFGQIENDDKELRKLRSELKANKQQYEADVVKLWQDKVSERIFVFADAVISKEYETVKDDYDRLYEMLRVLRQDDQETMILEKWDPLLSGQISAIQKIKLEELCSSLDEMSYQELISLVRTIKVKYSFDDDISRCYIGKANQYIAAIEKQQLDEIVSGNEELSSDRYDELIEKIGSLNLKAADRQPYIELLNQYKRSAEIAETCVDENLETWEMPELEKLVDAINGSAMRQNKKDELIAKVNSYIALFREGKDKNTQTLLESCREENIENYPLEKLARLRNEITAHPVLDDEVKRKVNGMLAIQISKRKFENEMDDAAGNYDALIELYSKVPNEQLLPEDFREEFIKKILNDILESQRASIEKYMSGYEQLNFDQLKTIQEIIRRYDFDKNILNENMELLDRQIDIAENKALNELCVDISSCKIGKLEKNQRSNNPIGIQGRKCTSLYGDD